MTALRRLPAALLSLLALPALAGGPWPDLAPAPVSVSSAHYRQLSLDELRRLEVEKTKVNPATSALQRITAPQRYVFVPGELYEADLGYDEICRRLTETLAKKGFINAADDQGRIAEPAKVDLILRVNAGERPWRQPTIRTRSLAWRDGLVERPRGRTLTILGGDVFWESRSGGNDDTLGSAAKNENARGFGYGSAASTPEGGSPLNSGAALAQRSGAEEYEATRDFYLIVVDAFDYAELMQKGNNAPRLWTTFVAAPRQHGQKFSDVLATMLRVAAPYFGETTDGLQMFNDARAEVKLGEIQVIESEAKNLPDRR